MARTATRPRGESIYPTKSIAPVFQLKSPSDAAREFSSIIHIYSVGELAQATECNKETVKCWKKGRALPSGMHLMKLQAEFPSIQAWVDRQTGREHAHPESPQALAMMFARMEQVCGSNTPEGRAMRARLQQIAAEVGSK